MFELLLGHLVGDYLFQNEWMAMNKSKNNMEGLKAAVDHCLLYTLAVCVFMRNFDLAWFGVVFASHFFIDKFALAEYYMHYLKGKGMKDYVQKNSQNRIPNGYDMLEGGFTSIVYTLTDNTMHLLLMWGAYKILY